MSALRSQTNPLIAPMFVDLGSNKSASGWVSVDGQSTADYTVDFEKCLLPFENESVSAFNCSHLFEHLKEIGQFALLEEVFRCLTSDGFAVFSFPNTNTCPHLAGYADHCDRALSVERFLGFQSEARSILLDRSLFLGHGLEKYDTGTLQGYADVNFDFDVVHAEWDLIFPYVVYPDEMLGVAYRADLNVVENFRVVLTRPGGAVDPVQVLSVLPDYEFEREASAVCQTYRHVEDCLSHFREHFSDLSLGISHGLHSAAAMLLMSKPHEVIERNDRRATRFLTALQRRGDSSAFEDKRIYITESAGRVRRLLGEALTLLDGRSVRAALPAQIVDTQLEQRVARLERALSDLNGEKARRRGLLSSGSKLARRWSREFGSVFKAPVHR